jgi:hypothetical protein
MWISLFFSQKCNRVKWHVYIIIALVLSSCSAELSELKTVLVNLEETSSVGLSYITDSLTKIELELTDKSIVGRIEDIIYEDGKIFIKDGFKSRIMVFDDKGKYIRTIGSRGQGPGEYASIVKSIAFDKKKQYLYIAAFEKIICYTVDGVFVSENSSIYPEYLYLNGEQLNVFSSQPGKEVDDGFVNKVISCRMDDNFNIIDSMTVQSIHIKQHVGADFPQRDYVSIVGDQIYVYHPSLIPEPVVRDTLYQIKNNMLVPYIKLKFSDDGKKTINSVKTKNILNIWRSERFVFADYQTRNGDYYFMYDMKSDKSFNMKQGFDDDIYNTGTVDIRPLGDDRFYFCYTEFADDQDEEPNPTIYIGKLNK